MNHSLRILALCLSALLPATTGRGAATLAANSTPRLWQPMEYRIEGLPAVENNFDPAQIRVEATITPPSGKAATIPAFWSQDYAATLTDGEERLQAVGAPGWRLRFTPTEPGPHQVSLRLAQPSAAPREVATAELSVPATIPPGPHGWVGLSADRRQLATSDGRALRLIGENMCWPQRGGTFDYDTWFGELQRSGQNFARLWMCPWWLPLEQGKDSLNRYNLEAAWRLDRIFQLAEQHGIYLLVCLDFHGMFQVDNPHWGGSGNWWTRSPYCQTNGGPCTNPNDFFTSTAAREIYQKRLRYMVARYGANSRLLAWQFFNEIDNAYAPHVLHAPDVAAWHRDVGRWLKQNDPYQHLVTTSLTGGSDRPEIWSLPEMDLSVYHSYGDPAPARQLATLAADHTRRYQKPVLIGEFGTDWRGWGGRTSDPHLRGQKQALWGAALSAAVGPAASWWWEEIRLDQVQGLYSALSATLNRAGWHEGNWTPADVKPAAAMAPKRVGDLRPGGAVITADLALNSVVWLDLDGSAALTGQLAAERSSESLSNYLGGTNQGSRQHAMRLDAWWAGGATLVLKVTQLGGDAELRVKIDGTEASRTTLIPIAPMKDKSSPTDRELTVPIPAGRHLIELDNPGKEWLFFGSIRAQGFRESTFADGSDFTVEPHALRQGDKALLYVVSPWAVYPAGALKYGLPIQRETRVSLTNWPAGTFTAHWFETATGREIATRRQRTDKGVLVLAVPDFADDLAAIVEREP